MRIIDLPCDLAPRLAQRFRIDARTRSGGVALSGTEQIVAQPVGLWRASVQVLHRSASAGQQWAGLIAGLQGRANGLRLSPACCKPRPMIAAFGLAETPPGGLPHSDGAFFSDGSGYGTPWPRFVTAASAALFADTITLALGPYAGGFSRGLYLMLGGRMRIVTEVVEQTAEQATIRFAPPLTAPLAAGNDATTQTSIVMRLAADDSGWPDDEFSRVQRTVVDLVEVPGLS